MKTSSSGQAEEKSSSLKQVRRKNSSTVTAAAAAAPPPTKKKPPKKKTATNSGKKKKKNIVEPPFELYQNPSNPSFAEGFASIISMLQQCKRIVVLSGAGISVSCGIPDFRTRGSGLYSTLDFEAYGLSCAEELFDWDVFQDNPVPFFKFARHLYFPTLVHNNNNATTSAAVAPDNGGGAGAGNDAGDNDGRDINSGRDGAATTGAAEQPPPRIPQRARPSDSHKLLALLEQKKKLLRVYSQNIDGLEQQAGVSAKKVVYAHGTLQWATCRKCKRKVSAQEMEADILAGTVAYCQAPIVGTVCVPTCNNHTTATTTNNAMNNLHDGDPDTTGGGGGGGASATLPTAQSSRESTTRSGSNKRPRAASITPHDNQSNNNNSNTNNAAVCGGVLKPGVTFFGETLKDTVGKCLEADRNKVDALIVIGTSLSVAPISKVIHYLPPNIPRILINRTIVHPEPKQQQQQAQNNVHDDDSSSSSSSEEEEDFRDDYVFDAYLLGYCDDVTRALVKHLFASPDEAPPDIEVGRLVANLVEKSNSSKLKENESHNNDGDDDSEKEEDQDDEEDSPYNAQDWASIAVPKNRVFLFPGATPNNDLAWSSSTAQHGDSTVESPRFCEIAHCDNCAQRIMGTIQKCVTCFDYDLCPDCYPTISKTHHGGKHVFCAEPAAPLVPSRD